MPRHRKKEDRSIDAMGSGRGSSAPVLRKRCAVYTRKSTEEGLDMAFNSLDAQREACEAYVASQRNEGWTLVPDYYDDGGHSGGTLERPALQRLLQDIEDGRVDVVVVYKIDRLSRSLMDFAKLVEVFDRNEVTFVSITQSFNTTTSMGRLTLNILLSFAQFEREVIGERIRDKFAASRKRGMWMGGWTPLGYRVANRKLEIVEDEAETVRKIFRMFVRTGSATKLAEHCARTNIVNKQGRVLDKGAIYKLLHNRVYIGEAVHKGKSYPGEHKAIIDRKLWDEVHAILAANAVVRANRSRSQTPALLRGLLYGPDGRALSPTHTRKKGRLYRYYVSQTLLKGGARAKSDIAGSEVMRVPANEVEQLVIGQLRRLLTTPEIIAGTWKQVRKLRAATNPRAKTRRPGHQNDDAAKRAAGAEAGPTGRSGVEALADRQDGALTEDDLRTALHDFEPLWDELFPAEQARIVNLLVEQVEVREDAVSICFRVSGLTSLICELRPAPEDRTAVGKFKGFATRAGSDTVPAKKATEARSSTIACPEFALSDHGSKLTIIVPASLQQHGSRKQVVTPDGSQHIPVPQIRIDNAMVKALARAFRWRKLLESGTCSSISDIARAENINSSYVSRVLRLSLLAPALVDQILVGRQPPGLQLDDLLERFPIEWEIQRQGWSC